MTTKPFPDRITSLPAFAGPFEATRLVADGCDVLFASYPSGTTIDQHTHQTENAGVITAGELILVIDDQESRYGPGDWYHVPAWTPHAARFEVDTAEIELWFENA